LNKLDNQITQSDKGKIDRVLSLLGRGVEAAADYHNLIETQVGVREGIDSMEQNAEDAHKYLCQQEDLFMN
jgi:hypothetical protein